MPTPYSPIPLAFEQHDEATMLARADAFFETMRARRSCRHFAPDPIPRAVIERCIAAAGQAPSGANKQPWQFVVVADSAVKRAIRAAAEVEEREFYEHRAPDAWKADLAPLGTDWRKPFIETAPLLVALFRVDFALPAGAGAELRKHYYVTESVGIAAGLFLAACQHAGLATLTHTPSPMGFLRRILARPANETPFLLIPVGYPAADAVVPDIDKKPLAQILTWR